MGSYQGNISTMQLGYIAFFSLATVFTLGDCTETATKAASPLINCGCQCSPLTWRDAAGHVQGNCRTVDGTGAQWCYVDPNYSSCQDLVPSKRFPSNPWSYEACATPAQGSPLCPGYVAPSAPVVPVPAAPAHVHPEDFHTHPVHVHPVEHHPPHLPCSHNNPVGPSSAVGGQGPSIQEIFGNNGAGGYDPESIGEPRYGDASSKINLPGLN